MLSGARLQWRDGMVTCYVPQSKPAMLSQAHRQNTLPYHANLQFKEAGDSCPVPDALKKFGAWKCHEFAMSTSPKGFRCAGALPLASADHLAIWYPVLGGEGGWGVICCPPFVHPQEPPLTPSSIISSWLSPISSHLIWPRSPSLLIQSFISHSVQHAQVIFWVQHQHMGCAESLEAGGSRGRGRSQGIQRSGEEGLRRSVFLAHLINTPPEELLHKQAWFAPLRIRLWLK